MSDKSHEFVLYSNHDNELILLLLHNGIKQELESFYNQ